MTLISREEVLQSIEDLKTYQGDLNELFGDAVKVDGNIPLAALALMKRIVMNAEVKGVKDGE